MIADIDDVFPLTDAAPDAAKLVSGARASEAAAAALKPKPQAILPVQQRLARLSPQPDRLVAVLAARVPLLEAARPLLDALARIHGNPGAARFDDFHRTLMHEVPTFQSVCQDARLSYECILAASYVLCTALDEVASNSLLGRAAESTAQTWAGRLAPHFHGDSKGGEGVFRLLGYLVHKPQENLDLLELVILVLALGFEGAYRNAPNGRRALHRIQEQVYSLVYIGRGGIPSPRWVAIERLLKEGQFTAVLSASSADLFS
jgi:type VI secretion system protein ImpK